MDLLISLVIFCLVAGLVYWLISLLPLPPTVQTVVLILFVLICLLYLLRAFVPGLV